MRGEVLHRQPEVCKSKWFFSFALPAGFPTLLGRNKLKCVILHIGLRACINGSACADTGMGTTCRSMVLGESWPTLSSPGLTEREKSTLTTMSTGQWATMWVRTFETLLNRGLVLCWIKPVYSETAPYSCSTKEKLIKHLIVVLLSLCPVLSSLGTDLLQVAAHEFGHVLGLQHSLEPDAVMCPFYSDSYPLQLSEDDKRGIQYLYGPPRHAPPEMTETNDIDVGMVRLYYWEWTSKLDALYFKISPVSTSHVSPQTEISLSVCCCAQPDACRTSFDAVSMIRGELFFFKFRYVWRIRDGQLQPGYPALASRHWRGIPDHIDAAYEDKSGNIWFFQGWL